VTDGDITFFVDENQCAIVSGDVYITSRLINGSFPDYEQIIPKEYVSHVTLLTQDFAHALKKTNVFLNKFMQLTLMINDRSVTLSSQSSDIGTTEESVTASVEGAALTLSFNQRYFSEIISHLTDDSVIFHFAGIGRPVVIENAHDRSLRYLVMPMNK
jgi:DNA polymerase-3 subunit beta